MSVLERYLAAPEPVDLARPDRLDSFSSRATGTVGLTDGGSSCLVLAALTWVLSGYVITLRLSWAVHLQAARRRCRSARLDLCDALPK